MPAPAPWTWRTSALALLWSVCVFTAYMANGREIFSGDTVPAKYLTFALVRGEGFYLDRYRREAFKVWPNPSMPYYLQMVDGHYVSQYPVGPAILALPFSLPQILYLDWTQPGWDTTDSPWFDIITKRSTAAITTMAGLALLVVLLRLGLKREAWLAATAAALGSNLWCTASQSLWQHGPAALMLTLVVLLLLPDSPSRLRFFLAGLAAALLVCCAADRARVCRHDGSLGHISASTPARLVPPPGGHDRVRAHRLQPRLSGACDGSLFRVRGGASSRPRGRMGCSGRSRARAAVSLFSRRGRSLPFVYLPFAFFQLRLRTLLPWLLATLVAHATLDLDILELVGRVVLRPAVLDRGHSLAGDRAGPGAPVVARPIPAALCDHARLDRGVDRHSAPGRSRISQRLG